MLPDMLSDDLCNQRHHPAVIPTWGIHLYDLPIDQFPVHLRAGHSPEILSRNTGFGSHRRFPPFALVAYHSKMAEDKTTFFIDLLFRSRPFHFMGSSRFVQSSTFRLLN